MRDSREEGARTKRDPGDVLNASQVVEGAKRLPRKDVSVC
jgi:hypothetical protein